MKHKITAFGKRMGIAFTKLFIPLQTAVILFYFLARLFNLDNFFFVQTVGFVLPWLFFPVFLLLPLALWRRSKPLVVMAGLVTIVFLFVYGSLFLPKQSVQISEPTFKVMSYNVLCCGNMNLEKTLANIRQHDPDILALHEYTPYIAAELDDELAADYAYRQVEDGRGFYSRYPIEVYDFLSMPGSFGGGAQKALVNVGGTLVTVLSVHPVRPPVQSTYIRGLDVNLPLAVGDTTGNDSQMAAIIDEVTQIEEPLVLVGDFNLTDQNPAYTELTQYLVDTFVERGMGMGFTFTPFGNYPLPVWRIDYVFHSDEITAVDIEVGEFAGSDHKPLIATLSIAGGGVVENK